MSSPGTDSDRRELGRQLVEQVCGLLAGRARRDVPLGALTTYRVGGSAAVMIDVRTYDDLRAISDALSETGGQLPLLVLGKGSNLLVSDKGFEGVVVVLGTDFARSEVQGTLLRAGGAAGLPVIARQSAAFGLSGLEWAVGVPGSVGGALRMNAGGHGSDTSRVVVRYEAFDFRSGKSHEHDAADLELGYRSSALRSDEVVTWAEFGLLRGDRGASEAKIRDIVRWRREHQPGGSNAGSVFTNPPGDSAGRLIEEAGLKGLRIGSAQVSQKHANFFQADEGGSADDVRRLIDHVRHAVAERTGVLLVPELRMVGFTS